MLSEQTTVAARLLFYMHRQSDRETFLYRIAFDEISYDSFKGQGQ